MPPAIQKGLSVTVLTTILEVNIWEISRIVCGLFDITLSSEKDTFELFNKVIKP